MDTKKYTNSKRGGQVRGEHAFGKKRGGQVRDKKEERINGAPVYTATYKVNRSDELLEFLLRKCNTSRNNVKSLLVRKQVLVNGSVVTQYNFVLAKDDEVKIAKKPMKDAAVAKIPPTSKRANMPVRSKLPIIYEDEDFIAIDKPVGLLSVESDKETDCAYGYVLAYMQAKDKNARPFILHRIDKETSGVLVFAKNVKIHSMLKLHWNEQVQTREYYAIVEGVLEKKADTVTSYLKENVNNLVYSTKDPSGQKAVTHYEVVKENEKFSLLKVQIDTGRKNQIRVHMKDLGHSIVGDEKYGHTENPIGRLGLHASKLVFIHPVSKELITLNATLPPAFRGLFPSGK
ncbi:MAG: RluA family pseudouridine synthase [Clostridia bacterium]|nr:RluA family pseudouridine synthase [Clostridia bacterium]